MKILGCMSFALFLLMVLIEGCQKAQLVSVVAGQLVASKTTVKFNEPDTLILIGAENDSVKWSITPSGSNATYKNTNKAVVVFLKAGIYTVSATAPGQAPLTKTITVLNENFYPPAPADPTPPADPFPLFTHVPITNDNIVITPHYYKMPTSDSTYFILTAQTGKTYPCGNSSLNISQSQTNNNYIVNIVDIIQPGNANCALPNTQLKGSIYFIPIVASPIVLGTTYPLTVTVGSTTYTGVITFNKTYMDIVWNYTYGVIMSSTHVTL